MPDTLSGTLHVRDSTELVTETETVEVLAYPLQAGMGWEAMVARTAELFRPHDGRRATLSGERHGHLLASARLADEAGLAAGTYSGRVESESGDAMAVELRLDHGARVISADFSRHGIYLCSLRSRFTEEGGKLEATSPRVIFDTAEESIVGGSLEVTPTGGGTVEVRTVLPAALPEVYTGRAAFSSPHYRVLNIEIDKLDGMPWPPQFAAGDVEPGHQPADLWVQDVSLATLFDRAGIEARLHFSDGALASDLGEAAGRPWETDRWDERELHEMMDRAYSRGLDAREWWLYLLVVTRFDGGPDIDQDGNIPLDEAGRPRNGGRGTTGIIFDSATGAIQDPWTPFVQWFEQNHPQFRHLFDFGRTGSFQNSRARQGVAVFWREMLDFAPEAAWERNRWFLRTIVHELGHALNLAHTWLVNRPTSLSFMNYPHQHPSGRENYWKNFTYEFDPEELFHCQHGFLNEVVPGGRNEFMRWSASSVFVDPTAGGTRSNLSLAVRATKQVFRFTEPVTIESRVRNHSGGELAIGKLSPSFGNLRYVLRKPNGTVQSYTPPVYKCEIEPTVLDTGADKRHLTSLAVDAHGFTFDTPGRYELTASMPDPSSGALVVARPVSIWVGYPDAEDEAVAHRVFDRDTGLFLYMAGGHHLEKAQEALREVTERHPDHPFATHANLVLGLNELAGQKRPFRRRGEQVTAASPEDARPYLEAAATSRVLSEVSQHRLEATLEHFVYGDGDGEPGDGKGGGGGAKKKAGGGGSKRSGGGGGKGRGGAAKRSGKSG